MRASRQLILESAIVAGLLILIVAGGNFAGLQVPAPWANIQNPDNMYQQSSGVSYQEIAIFYNLTLTSLGEARFANTFVISDTFGLLNIPTSVQAEALDGNQEIANINASLPLALTFFNETILNIGQKNYLNASRDVSLGCNETGFANENFTTFDGATSRALSNLGVPVSLYAIGAHLVDSEILAVTQECQRLSLEVKELIGGTDINFTISSSQPGIETGGTVMIYGTLTRDGSPLAGQFVSFYFNYTKIIGNTTTGPNGTLEVVLGIPFVYVPLGIIYAEATSNDSINFVGKYSNQLNFSILFSATQISIKDPSAYLPGDAFAVNGNLSTVSGTPLPNAPVRITFFNTSYYATTDQLGMFTYSLTVPSNASDGVWNVYAAFYASGIDGPSFNLTSIQVYHLETGISLSSDYSGYTYSGSSIVFNGRVFLPSNDTGVANATVSLSSQWGLFLTTTNSIGGFSLKIPVPIWEFASNQNLSISATPPEPYLSSASFGIDLKVFNFLWIVFPGMGIGIGLYEGKNFGLLPKIKAWARKPRFGFRKAEEPIRTVASRQELVQEPKSIDVLMQTLLLPKVERIQSKIVVAYREALTLAASNFRFEFKESSTIREIIAQVKGIAGDTGASGVELFASISLAMEDYIYAAVFDESREEEAKKSAAGLKLEWGGTAEDKKP